MNAIQIKNQIDICNSDATLTRQQKNLKLCILTTALQTANREQQYNKYVEKYKNQGLKLEQITNEKFKLSSNIIITEVNLRDYLINSYIGMYLKAKGIKVCTFDEVLAHANMLADANPNFNKDEVELAINFYMILEQIGKIEREIIDTIANGLCDIIGINTIFEDKKILVVNDKTNEAKVKSQERTYDEFEINHNKALNTINNYREKLGDPEYKYAVTMINKVFEYYKNGNKEIKLPEQLREQIVTI